MHQTVESGITRFLRLIRFSHTIFALPFALASLVVAAKGWPPARVLLLVLGCMMCARTAAMLFNRIVDWKIDQRNPRTADRHRLLSKTTVAVAFIASSAAFVVCSALLNRLTATLAPLALVIVCFYSITKRFTNLTHFFLGLALSVAPIGAWIAQRGRFDLPPFVLAAGVICWVAGFDLIYATQDFEFDRREGLHSLVVRLGIQRSLRLAELLHGLMLIALIAFGAAAHLGVIYYSALAVVLTAIVYEHRVAKQLDLAAINRAFFSSNAFVSAVVLVATCADVTSR